MYEQFFNLNIRPFTTTPYVKHYFATQTIQKALSQCQTSIQRGSGPAVVVGHLGTGKSLLLNLLADRFRDHYQVVHLGCARFEQRRELLQSILFNLNQSYRELSEIELRLALIDFLKPGGECPSGLLLLVDEAHLLSPDLLDELRLITNIVHENQPRVRMVVAGGQALEENLANPRLEPFNQRIAARCFLGNLVRDETFAYVLAHVDRAGGDGRSIFTPCGLEGIYETSGGCPRVINQLCDKAMLLAASAQSDLIDQAIVREAWGDIQCIPGTSRPHGGLDSGAGAHDVLPGSPVSEGDVSEGVIEFGELDDEPESPSVEAGTSLAEPVVAPVIQSHSDTTEKHELPQTTAEDYPLEGVASEIDEQEISVQSTGWMEAFAAEGLVDCTGGVADEAFGLDVAEQNIKSLEVNQEHMHLLEEVYGSRVLSSELEEPSVSPPVAIKDEGPTRNPLTYESPIWVDPAEDQPLHLFQEAAVEAGVVDELPAAEETLSLNDLGIGTDELRLTDDELHELDSVASAVERLERSQADTVERDEDRHNLQASETMDVGSATGPARPAEIATTETGADLTEAEMLMEQIRHFTEAANFESAEEAGQPANEEWSETLAAVDESSESVPRRDDRDMLVVSRSEQLNVRAAEADSEKPQILHQPSTGQAIRMDYHQLFEQLRNA